MRNWLVAARHTHEIAVVKRCRFSVLCVAVAMLFSLLVGCSTVVMLQPLPQVADALERSVLEGEWLTEATVVAVRFSSNGTGCIAGLDWREDHFQLDEGELITSKIGDKKFFSVRFREKGKWEEQYYFARYHLTEGGDLVIWPPAVAAFENAVARGLLEGSVEKGAGGTRVTVTSVPEKLLAFLGDQETVLLFEYEEPIVLRRLFPRLGTRR